MLGHAERFDKWVRRSPPVLVLALVLFLVTTAGAVFDRGDDIWSWYQHRFEWRAHEYAKLHALRAGYTIATFEQVLGAPIFTRTSYDRRWAENTFRGRDYWVQAVSQRGAARKSVV